METDVIYITDHEVLDDLNRALDKCSDDLSKILQQVDAYLIQTKQGMEKQKEVFEKQYHEAEECWNRARQMLSACEACRHWDEEDRCYRPSCVAERRHVDMAAKHMDRCREKYDEACRIVDRANRVISDYHRHSMINPGPEQRMQTLVDDHTDAATKELSSIIDDVAAYLSIAQNNVDEAEKKLSQEAQERYEQLNEEIRKQQVDDMRYQGIASPRQLQICPGCGQPIAKCICGKIHNREYIK